MADSDNPTVTSSEVFSALANETRVEILQAIWSADEPGLSFSQLRDTVGMDDSGQFNYHLSQLRGKFVRLEDGKYQVTVAGRRVVGAILSGMYTQAGVHRFELAGLLHEVSHLPTVAVVSRSKPGAGWGRVCGRGKESKDRSLRSISPHFNPSSSSSPRTPIPATIKNPTERIDEEPRDEGDECSSTNDYESCDGLGYPTPQEVKQ